MSILLYKKIRNWFLKKNDHTKKLKLGISYNLFDGEELLEASIKSVRPSAFHISIVYQTVSNGGEKRENTVIEEKLASLKKDGLIDEYVLYKPNLRLSAKRNEKNKRQLGLKIAKKAGCTHYLSMDVDEFYFADEIESAKKFIIKNNIECSAVSIIEYVKRPEYQLVNNYMFVPAQYDPERYTFQVPFICKINVSPKVKLTRFFPCLVDPTRKMNGGGRFYLFPKHKIAMHHMSTVRKDLDRKFRNSTITLVCKKKDVDHFSLAKQAVLQFNFDESREIPQGYTFIGKYLVKKVENYFNIKFE